MANLLNGHVQIGILAVTWHDIVAGVVAIMGVAGVILLAALDHETPSMLGYIDTTAIVWLFRGASDRLATNGH